MTREEANKIIVKFSCEYEGLLGDIMCDEELLEIPNIQEVESYILDCSDYLVDISEKNITVTYDDSCS